MGIGGRMKIYERIIIFFLVCIVLITLLVTNNQSNEIKQFEILSKDELSKKQLMMNDLLLLENKTNRMMIEDYSNWDDMANFVKENNQTWAIQNIDTLTDTLNVPFIWVFNNKSILVHSYFTIPMNEEMIHLFTREILIKAFENKRSCHFFLPTSLGITEITGSVITDYAEDPSSSPVQGYLLIGRVWDETLIKTLSNLGSYFKTEMELSTVPFPYNFDKKTSMLQMSKPLYDPFGSIVSYLGIRIPSDILAQFYRIIHRYYYVWSFLIGIFLLLILFIFFTWIFPPLRLLSETLVSENQDHLSRLKNNKSEFGEMARLMIAFFQQKELFKNEIAEKKEALQELVQSEEHFRVLSETLPCYVLILQDNKINYVNSLFCIHFEFSIPELDQQDFYGFVHPDYQEIVKQETIMMQIDSSSYAHLEVPVLTKSGNAIWLDLSLGKTTFHNHPAVIVSGFDITEQKKSQQELKNTLMIKSNFTSMVSHELRTPLSAIKGSIDLVSEAGCGELNGNQKTALQIAKRNVDRLHRLINEILDFQKLESGKVAFRFTKCDIKEIVEEAIKTMTPLITEKGLTIFSELPPYLSPVKADRDRIMQVFINLINNAIKFTLQGKITIKCSESKDFVQVKVQDTGVGIRKEDTEKLFNQYTQLTDNSLQKYPGTGLGLAICKEIINRHGGQISVTSEIGVGTTFVFTLTVA
jgi:PAS domain S-box-containing protein